MEEVSSSGVGSVGVSSGWVGSVELTGSGGVGRVELTGSGGELELAGNGKLVGGLVSCGGVGCVDKATTGVVLCVEGSSLIVSSMSLNLVKIVFCVSCICFCTVSTAFMRESRQSTV